MRRLPLAGPRRLHSKCLNRPARRHSSIALPASRGLWFIQDPFFPRELIRMRAAISLILALSCLFLPPSLSAQAGTGKPTAVLISGPEVGRRAPDFTLPWASKDGLGPADNPYQL